MKILFDNQKFTTDAHGGIVRVFAELMRYYDQMPDVEYDMPITFSNTECLKALPRFRNVQPLQTYDDFLPKLKFRGKGRLYRLWCRFWSGKDNQKKIVDALKKGNFDILHPTYYDPSLLDDLNGKPYVLSVYDMIHELFLSKFVAIDPTIAYKKKMVENATRIIAISESTKQDLIKILNVPAEKIDVVYLGNSLVPTESDLLNRPENVPSRYLLFVGTRIRYKNFLKFAKAVAPLLRDNADLHLLCIGWTTFDAEEKELFENEEITAKVHQLKASDKELARYYAHAEAFVFPSLYEGFGIPVLEAFACNCPAIISNSSSLSEIGEDAAAYFDPTDEASIYSAVKQVIDSPQRRQELIAAGQEQLKKFSWEKMAYETVEVYKRALADHQKKQAA